MMNQILLCDWLGCLSRQNGAILPALDYLLCPTKDFPESHIINSLLTKLVWSRWLDIGLILFFFLQGGP